MSTGYFTNYAPPVSTPYFPGSEPYSPPDLGPILFENELANYLRTNIGVNAYPNKLPQANTNYPLLSFTVFDGDDDLLLSGPSGLCYRGIQFDCYSPLFAQAAMTTQTIWNLFKNFTGTMGRVQVLNVTRHLVKTFSYPPVNGGDGSTMYRYMAEYKFWFRE